MSIRSIRRIPTSWLRPAAGALCAVMLAAAPASAFRGGDGGRGGGGPGGGGRSSSLGPRPSGTALGARPSAGRPGLQGPPGRGGQNGAGDRVGRGVPSTATTGSRFGGNDRGVALRGRSEHRGHSSGGHKGWHGNKHGPGHKHDHDRDCHGGYWHRPYWWYPGSYYYYSYVIPAPIFVTTPFLCGLCNIGFAGDTYFHHHLHSVHSLPFSDIDSYLFAVDGRIVFNGW